MELQIGGDGFNIYLAKFKVVRGLLMKMLYLCLAVASITTEGKGTLNEGSSSLGTITIYTPSHMISEKKKKNTPCVILFARS